MRKKYTFSQMREKLERGEGHVLEFGYEIPFDVLDRACRLFEKDHKGFEEDILNNAPMMEYLCKQIHYILEDDDGWRPIKKLNDK